MVFGPVYTSLADLAGWTKQEGMPIPNAHAYAPPTYFQNFVFDYGDYHFVCLDFCARDDFDPDDWELITDLFGIITFPKFQFGYADTHDDYGNDGTIKWFEDHLERYGYCDPDTGYDRGYKRSKNIILISHHAPIFNLNGTGTYDRDGPGPIPPQNINWELQNENTYGFNQNEYNDLVSLLNSLSAHDFNYHWFTGHYERKNMEWTDTQIIPNTPVKVIASVQPLSWVPDIPGLVIYPTITINNVHSVTTEDNLNGQITIVKVLSPGGTDPDPSIYNQRDPDAPIPVVWDNPDIEFYDSTGTTFVPSGQLDYNNKYEIRARIYNKGCSDAKINVRFTWGKAPNYAADNDDGFSGGNVASNIIGPITIHSGEEIVVGVDTIPIKWNTNVVAPGPGLTTVHACVHAIIEPINMDSNLNNNRGQENCDVRGCAKAASDEVIEFSFPIWNPTNITNGITVDVYPEVGTLWNPEIILPEIIPPYSEGNVTLRLYPIPGVDRNVGDSEIFSLIVRRLDTDEIDGGLDVKVVVDDPPILNWTGDVGYQTDGVEPDEGNAGTTFTFKVMYKDENNHAPAKGYPQLHLFKGDEQIEGRPFVMNEEDPTDTDYTDGKNYFCPITLTEEGDDYTHGFLARDELGVPAEGPATQIKEGPIVKEVPIPPTSLKEFFVTGDPNGNVYVYWSNNDGTFIRSKIGDVTNSGATPGSCAGAAIADYDHDGDLDVFMGNIDTGAIYLFTNIGSGNFAPPILCTTIPAPLGMDATIADFDNNGDYDYIAVGSNRRDIYIVPNIAAGGPNPTLIWTCRSGHVIDGVDAGDFNEDGNMDFLAVEYWTGSDNEVRLFEGNGDGTFKNPVVAFTAPSAATDGLPAVAVGDFNRDGHLDAIYGHDDGGDPGQAWLYLGDGNSNFAYRGDAYDVNPAESGADQPGGGLIDAFDFNKDGYLDIVATCCWSGPADDPVKGVYYIPENTPPLPPYFNDPTGPMDPSSIAKRMHAIAAPPLDGRWLVNPGWKIFLNSAGYSDILYCTPPAPYIEYEILSGEWAAALKYDDITNTGLDPTNPFGAQWLTQEFIYPGWPTGSPFKVIEPIRTWDNPYNPIDGPDAGHSAIANDRVRIDIEYSMVETSEGTPMGMSPDPESGSFVMSSKHVMLQRYTIKNIGDQTLNNFKFFQFLHAHPKGTWCPEILYDSERYLPGRPFAGYHYDITLWRQFGSGSHPEATECIGFSSDERPDYFGLGGYDDHDPGKPDIGLHWHIESADELPGNTHLSDLPAQNRLAGAEGWVLGRLEPNEQVSVRTLLAIHNPRLGAAPDYVDPWKDINEELDELIKKVKAATMPSTIKQSLVDRLEHAKTLMENAKTAHEAGNDAQAKNYLGVAKSQVGFFESMVKITRRISETDKKEFLRESSKIIEKIDTLIESL